MDSSADAILKCIQDISGLTFSSFLVLHLAAPIAAGVVSSSSAEAVASSVQLATRVIYQDGRIREFLLVWGSLGTHVVVSVVRRIARLNRRRKLRAQLEDAARRAEPRTRSPRKGRSDAHPPLLELLKAYLPKTSHSIAAYLGLPFLVDHILNHRLRGLPSHRSYGYVAYNLQQRPISSCLKYAALVVPLTYHALISLWYMNKKHVQNSKSSNLSILEAQQSVSARLAWFGLIGAVGFGIRKMAREEISPWLARRYK
ncbi:hypothetical protein O181_060372 [Austropuccinia psidii MF-1]|uniref:Mitochondrial adapter protein MCP1 transmembrane domain-containing protein n=1 Tax=Austropuccinia psidii MF-1 TaxID=1389203 RepID=A0A9Q3EIJ9_9BASI|nr:hypothetical protein [Austropuccinia psidii MF-1]